MGNNDVQPTEARNALWASLGALLPEIESLAGGNIGDTQRERQVIQLVARIVVNEYRLRASSPETVCKSRCTVLGLMADTMPSATAWRAKSALVQWVTCSPSAMGSRQASSTICVAGGGEIS